MSNNQSLDEQPKQTTCLESKVLSVVCLAIIIGLNVISVFATSLIGALISLVFLVIEVGLLVAILNRNVRWTSALVITLGVTTAISLIISLIALIYLEVDYDLPVEVWGFYILTVVVYTLLDVPLFFHRRYLLRNAPLTVVKQDLSATTTINKMAEVKV